MRLGAVLGIEGRQKLSRHAAKMMRLHERQRRLAAEADANRKRNRGEIVRYNTEDR